MNTTAKGDQFEEAAHELFSRMIDEDRFYIRKENCRLRKKPKYYSRDRESNIIFDLSIEVWMRGASRPSLVIPIECKNYGHPVPVNDIEEFSDKCRQVQAHKGVLISRTAFQKGTQSVAKNRNIGLIRYFGNAEHKWILERSTAANLIWIEADEREALSELLCSTSEESQLFDLVCYSPAGATASLWEFFDDLTDNNSTPDWLQVVTPMAKLSSSVPFLEAESIEDLAIEAGWANTWSASPLDLNMICANQSKNGLQVISHATNPPSISTTVLGSFDLLELKIELFESNIRNRQQLRFTLAHELGHLFLGHKKYLMCEKCEQDDFDNNLPRLSRLTDIARLEWQANRFASALLMPRRPFVNRFREMIRELNIKDRGYGLLYVDGQPCNQESFSAVCIDLSRRFDASFSAVAVRLSSLGLLNDQRVKATYSGQRHLS